MSDQDTIFGNQSKEGDGSSSPNSDSALGDLLKGITNEKGEQKYSDVGKAMEALANSQAYIPELQKKMDEKDAAIATLKEQLGKASAVDEVLERLQATHQGQEVDQPKGLDAEGAAKLFENLLSKSQQEAARSSNIGTVTATLKEAFGENAEKEFYDKGKQLGLSADALNDLAGTSPAAVLALFGRESKGTSPDVSTGSQNLGISTPSTGAELGRNKGDSVLMGSTSRMVRAEFDTVKELVKDLHDKGMTVEDLTDPKQYRKIFG